MSLQFVSDNSGRKTAVLIPIDEWNLLRRKHPDLEEIENDIPQWQKDILDNRMKELKANPGQVTLLEDFLKELDSED
ncbi:MAG: addiction module protein [Taibaiella sp.]|nr:addiction module protein [Taibaiella sp.]